MNKVQAFKEEFLPMLKLAWPIVLANLGWMGMGIIDTMMVGRVSPEAIGAISLGGVLFITVAMFGGGVLLGLDTLVPRAYGAGNLEDCHRCLVNSLTLCLPMASALMGIVRLGVPFLRHFGIHPAVLGETVPYIHALTWSMAPLLLYFSFAGYLRGMSVVKPTMFALVSANLVNAAGNWVLIYGHFGAPRLGAEGAGWSTTLARIYMALVLLGYILYYDRRKKTHLANASLSLDFPGIRRLASLGLPAATQIVVEIAVFAAATVLIGKLDPVSLAAHQIALNMASFTFMVPMGIGSAAAVRVGQALGSRDAAGASHAGWTALVLGAGFMSAAALTFLVFPRAIVRLFTPDAAVIESGASLLVVAAFFQLFDGLQAVATGALRGAGDTRTPMLCHLLAYWLFGLPLGYVMCFGAGWGARGLWAGLCLALILIGLALLSVWNRRVRTFSALAASAHS